MVKNKDSQVSFHYLTIVIILNISLAKVFEFEWFPKQIHNFKIFSNPLYYRESTSVKSYSSTCIVKSGAI